MKKLMLLFTCILCLVSIALAQPYPASDYIKGVTWNWSSAGTKRLAEGADNWPITWAADGNQYTCFGDGWGFNPRLSSKASIGFCKIAGNWDNYTP
jgi:hypothetical protein